MSHQRPVEFGDQVKIDATLNTTKDHVSFVGVMNNGYSEHISMRMRGNYGKNGRP